MKLLLILKGILIGIGKIIPGVSGTIMAISMGVYDKAIDSVTHFFDDVWKHTKFLIGLGIGILVGIVFFSKVIIYFFDEYYVYAMILFLGLIMGGIRSIYQNSERGKYGCLFLFWGFVLMGSFSLLGGVHEYVVKGNFWDCLVYFGAGILEGIGTIIPGISSTALLMTVGVYDIFLFSVSNLLDIHCVISNLVFLVSFGLGLFFSIMICIYGIYYLFSRYKRRTFSFILGIVLSNLIILVFQVGKSMELKNLIIGVPLLGLGLFISLLFDIS